MNAPIAAGEALGAGGSLLPPRTSFPTTASATYASPHAAPLRASTRGDILTSLWIAPGIPTTVRRNAARVVSRGGDRALATGNDLRLIRADEIPPAIIAAGDGVAPRAPVRSDHAATSARADGRGRPNHARRRSADPRRAGGHEPDGDLD